MSKKKKKKERMNPKQQQKFLEIPKRAKKRTDIRHTGKEREKEREEKAKETKKKKIEEKSKEQNVTIKEAHRIKSARYISNECFDGFIC